MKYQELKGKCKICLGCNKLENETFKEIEQCENYINEYRIENLGVQERIKI